MSQQLCRAILAFSLSTTSFGIFAFRPSFPIQQTTNYCRSKFNSHPLIRKATDNNNENNANVDISELYKTVAEQDPEWYKEFVLNVLGENVPVVVKWKLDNSPSGRTTSEEQIEPMEKDETVSKVKGKGENLDRKSQIPIDPLPYADNSMNEPEASFNAEPVIEMEVVMSDIPLANLALSEETNSQSVVEEMESISDKTLSAHSLEPTVEILSTPMAWNTTLESKETSFDQVIVYRDFYRKNQLQSVPLERLTSLGYTIEEIPFLQIDVLSLIVQDSIERPKRGIPPQWKISISQYQVLQDDIRIMSNTAAEDLLEASRTSRRAAAPKPVETVVQTPPVKETRDSPRYSTERSRRPTREESTQRRPTREEPIQRRPIRVEPTQRRSTSTRPSDPPAPQNPLWIDMDTFRHLLRREAELRVRILGDDWADTVKRESSWRLRLYKEWLWNLHDGVGEPLFQSQGERERRKVTAERRSLDSGDVVPSRRASTDRNKKVLNPRDEVRPKQSSRDDGDQMRTRPSRRRTLSYNVDDNVDIDITEVGNDSK